MITDAPPVALVESPAQLLNVLEWAAAGARQSTGQPPPARPGRGLTIVVLPPPEPAARLQLERMSGLATECGATVGWQEVQGGRAACLRSLLVIRRMVGRAPVLVLGDPFSRLMQVVVATTRPGRVVVVDDGSATLEFARVLTEGGPLVRWHRAGGVSTTDRLIAGRARRRLPAGPGRGSEPLELFTAMPVTAGPLKVVANRLAWTRSRFAPPRLLPGADLVGSSLVESGVVQERAYLQAVAELTASQHVRRYLAHRRESNDKLARISALGLQVLRPDLPLELYARTGPVAERVISFPSTVVHTLPLALADTPARIMVCDIAPGWYATGHRTGRSDRFLSSVAETARHTHRLVGVPVG